MPKNSNEDSNKSPTDLPYPGSSLTEFQTKEPNGLFTALKPDLVGRSVKKRVMKEKSGEERPAKRARINVKVEPVAIGALVGGPDSGQMPTAVSSKVTSVKRGRPSKVKTGGQTPDGKPKETPTRKGRPPKVKFEGLEGTVKEAQTRKAILAKAKENSKLEPRWRVFWPPSLTTKASSEDLVETTRRPRIWMSNREELLSVLPEMSGSKCFNGVSWELYETPTLLLDEVNTAFQVICKAGDPRSIDLVTMRKFVSPLQRKEPEFLVNPKSADYLAQMETTMHRFTSADAETPYSFDPVNITGPTARKSGSPIRTGQTAKAFEEENSFTQARTNFSAPLPIYNTFNMNDESLDSLLSNSRTNYPMSEQPAYAVSHTQPVTNLNSQKNDAIAHSILDIKAAVPFSNLGTISVSEKVQTSVVQSRSPLVRSSPPTVCTTAEVSQLLSLAARALEIGEAEPPRPTEPRPISTRQKIIEAIRQASKQNSRIETAAQSYPELLVGSTQRGDEESSQILGTLPYFSVAEGTSEMTSQSATNGLLANSVLSAAYPDVAMKPFSEGPNVRNGLESENGVADFSDGPNRIPKPEPMSEDLLCVSSDGQTTHNVTLGVEGSHNDPELVPSPLPQEIQTMIDAYLFGKPLTLIVSQGYLSKYWSLLLPKDVGYAMMGYFKIIGIQETRVDVANSMGLAAGQQPMSGQVKWLFRLQWRPGGEEYIMPKLDLQILEYPWWEPPSEKTNNDSSPNALMDTKQKNERILVNPEPEEDFPSTPRYRLARKSHPEYQYRHDHYRELYECLLPSFLLGPFGPLVLDSALSRGWYCEECGKVNYQATLRHRRCSSSYCKDKPPAVEPYALALHAIRDPQDRLPISLPYNVVPKSLRTNIKTYEGGIKTISYFLNETGSAHIAHIFTGNFPPLQEHATTLLDQIQLHVELKRPFNDNTPYFSYLARRYKGTKYPTDAPWENVPDCINDAKLILAARVRQFSEVEDTRVSMTQLKLLAWVASGSRKGPETLRATKKCIVLLSFGCDIVLTLVPRSMERSSVKDAPNGDQGTSINADTNKPDDITIKQEQVKASQIKASKKAEKLAIVLYLVHGDCVVLDGDDFEYSIKRDGTSLLLIASHHEKEI